MELDATGAILGRGPANPGTPDGKLRTPSRARTPERGTTIRRGTAGLYGVRQSGTRPGVEACVGPSDGP